jgi:hypothetical protein
MSGRPHTIEIWFALDERALYLLSGGGDLSGWRRSSLPVAVDLAPED